MIDRLFIEKSINKVVAFLVGVDYILLGCFNIHLSLFHDILNPPVERRNDPDMQSIGNVFCYGDASPSHKYCISLLANRHNNLPDRFLDAQITYKSTREGHDHFGEI